MLFWFGYFGFVVFGIKSWALYIPGKCSTTKHPPNPPLPPGPPPPHPKIFNQVSPHQINLCYIGWNKGKQKNMVSLFIPGPWGHNGREKVSLIHSTPGTRLLLLIWPEEAQPGRDPGYTANSNVSLSPPVNLEGASRQCSHSCTKDPAWAWWSPIHLPSSKSLRQTTKECIQAINQYFRVYFHLYSQANWFLAKNKFRKFSKHFFHWWNGLKNRIRC